MSIQALIHFAQAGQGPFTAGQAALGVDGTLVTVSNAINTGVTRWDFTVIDAPPSSAITPGLKQSGATPTWSFTPDVPDEFVIQLDVFDSLLNKATDVRVFAVDRPGGRRIPGFKASGASNNFQGQTRGWAPEMEGWLHHLDAVTWTELATLKPSSTRVQQAIDGYSTPGDGADGVVFWNPTDTRAADGGTIQAVSGVGTGRWNRVITGNVFNVKWFGAKGDGSTDDHAIVNAALAAMAGHGTLFFPAGTYKITSGFTAPAGVVLKFAPNAILKPDVGALITLSGLAADTSQQVFDLSNISRIWSSAYGVAFAFPFSSPSGKISVKWFGAKGDDSHDDTQAIQAAIDAALSVIDSTPLVLSNQFPAPRVYLPSGSYLVSAAPGISGPGVECLSLPDSITIEGDGEATTLTAGTTVAILRCGGYYQTIEKLHFFHGRNAIAFYGPSKHYGGSLGTVEAENGVVEILDCIFSYNAGPSIWMDTSIEHRGGAGVLIVNGCSFQTSAAFYGGWDYAEIRGCNLIASQDVAADPNAIPVHYDNGDLAAFFTNYGYLHVNGSAGNPINLFAEPTSAWIEGVGIIVSHNARYGGEAKLPIVRVKFHNIALYGESLDVIANGPESFLMLDYNAMSSAIAINWLEIYDQFPRQIVVHDFPQSFEDTGVEQLLNSRGIFIDSTSCPKSSYVNRIREDCLINLPPTRGQTHDFRFFSGTTRTDPQSGEDVTQQLKRFFVTALPEGRASLGEATNYWQSGSIDVTTGNGLFGTNVAQSGTDTTTGYSLTGLLFSGYPNSYGVEFVASGAGILQTTMPAGEYTISLAIKSTDPGQLSAFLGNPSSPGSADVHVASLDFSGGSQWQRVAFTIFYDGVANKSIAFTLTNIASTAHLFLGLFAVHKGRDAKQWLYPGNPTTQDVVHGVYWAAAAPSSGTYKVGDAVFNTVPSSGQPIGWVCTASPHTFSVIAYADGGPVGSAGGDLAGTYPNPTVANLSASSMNVGPSGPYAGAGEFRFPNNVIAIAARNAGNSQDVVMVQLDSSDNALYGDSHTSSSSLRSGGTAQLQVGSDFLSVTSGAFGQGFVATWLATHDEIDFRNRSGTIAQYLSLKTDGSHNAIFTPTGAFRIVGLLGGDGTTGQQLAFDPQPYSAPGVNTTTNLDLSKPLVNLSGNLPNGVTWQLNFGNTSRGLFLIDVSQLTATGSATLSLVNGTATVNVTITTPTTTADLIWVVPSTNNLAVNL